jgi:hypothetical protein
MRYVVTSSISGSLPTKSCESTRSLRAPHREGFPLLFLVAGTPPLAEVGSDLREVGVFRTPGRDSDAGADG